MNFSGELVIIGCLLCYGVGKLINKEKHIEVDKFKLQYLFSKSERSPKQKLIDVIDNSINTLDVAVYTITEKEIVAHLSKATERGVKVRVLTDKKQINNQYQSPQIYKLIESGIPVKVNSHDGSMHLKLAISDNNVVATGSYNFTKAAEQYNNEVLLIIEDGQVAKEMTKEFNKMWNNTTQFNIYPFYSNEMYA